MRREEPTSNFKILGRKLLEARGLHLVLLLAAASLLIFYNLGRNSFHNGDEAFYAIVVKEILHSGRWASPQVGGEVAFFKPPLMIWLSTLSSLVWGFSEFSVRLPAALFGVLTILGTYLLAESLLGRRAALLAAVMMLTCNQFIYLHSARSGEFDSAISFLVLLTAYCLWRSRRRKGYFLLAFASAGLVAMIKSAVAVIPLLLLILYLASNRRLGDFRPSDWAAGVGLLLLIALPWHLLQLLRYGRTFVDLYVLDQIFGRRVGSQPPVLLSDPLHYLRVVFRGFFPWSLTVPFALLQAAAPGSRAGVRSLLLLWLLSVFFISSLVTGSYSWNWYILPALPALAILSADFCRQLLRGSLDRRFVALSLAGIIVLLLIFVPERAYDPFTARAFRGLMQVELRPALSRLYLAHRAATFLALALAWLALTLVCYFGPRLLSPSSGRLLSHGTLLALLGLSVAVIVRPLRFSDQQSEFDRLNREVWSGAGSAATLVYFGNDLLSYLDYIYLYDFSRSGMNTVEYVGLDRDRLLLRAASSGHDLFFMERQHYNDLRRDERLGAVLPPPLSSWGRYLVLGNGAARSGRNPDPPPAEAGRPDQDAQARSMAVLQLGREGRRAALPLLVELLQDGEEEVVCAAARALSDLRVQEAAAPLRKALARHAPSGPTYQTLVLALAYLRDGSVAGALAELYSSDPVYPVGQAAWQPPPLFAEHTPFWSAYLLMQIDPERAGELLGANLLEHVGLLLGQGRELSTYNRTLALVYRVGNSIALDLAQDLLQQADALKKRIALYLLAKPSATITRLSEQDMDRAQGLLARAAGEGAPPEIRHLAREILGRYHRRAWVGW